MRTKALLALPSTLLVAVVASAVGCIGLAGPCVLPECDEGFVESAVPCRADESDDECHVIGGAAGVGCGGQVTCRVGDDDGE